MWDGGPSWPNHGYDCIDEDNDPYDADTEFWHGTHTAGLVVGDGSGGTSTGIAPGAALMALRCLPGYQTDMTEALQFALDEGADLITMSAGWQNPDNALKEANRYNADVLLAAGIPWCAAGGNGDNMGGHYAVPHDISSPGDCPNPWYGSAGKSGVVAVGATDSGDNVWSDSSYGPTEWNVTSTPGYDDYPYPPGLVKPDVAAPGVNVTSTVPGGYVAYSGTSMSTPIVAGGVAILRQASPGCTPAQLAEALEAGAVDVGAAGRDNYAGAGRIDIGASIAALPTSETEFVWLHNDGPVPLVVGTIGCSEPWLSVSPVSAAVDPGDSVRITLTFDGDGLADGVYFDEVTFSSNAPDSPHSLPVLAVKGSGTGVDGPEEGTTVPRAALAGHPNPFNPETSIRFENPAAGHLRLSVFDASGRLVAVIADGEFGEGRQSVFWDGRGAGGRTVASGTYFLRLEGAGETLTGKVTLLK